MSGPGYQVIARKWRPQRFAEVVGQQPVVRTLSNALDQGRVAHAYCFSGIRGVGKTTIARLLAKGLNCRASEGPTSDPCGRCESCVEIESSRSIDVLERDAASERGIDEMRQLIEVSRYAPSRDRYKVFILDEAHMLTKDASNALLKVLEEPPPWIMFMMATTEPEKILPTILSRCQHYQLGRISQRDIEGHLGKIASAEGVTITADALALLAMAADGSLRDGQSLLDKLIAFAGEQIDETTVMDLLGLVDRVLLYRATELIAAGDMAGVLQFVDELVDSGVGLHQFTLDLLGHFRNLLIVRTVDDAGEILHLGDGDIERLREQAAGFSVDDLDRAFSALAASEYRIKTAEQPRYHVEIVLARLARMPSLEPIQELLAQVRGDSGGSSGPAGDGGKRRGGGARAARPGPARGATAATTPASTPPSKPAPRPTPASRPAPKTAAPSSAPAPARRAPQEPQAHEATTPPVPASQAAVAEPPPAAPEPAPAPSPPAATQARVPASAAAKPAPTPTPPAPATPRAAHDSGPEATEEPPHPADDPRFGGPSSAAPAAPSSTPGPSAAQPAPQPARPSTQTNAPTAPTPAVTPSPVDPARTQAAVAVAEVEADTDEGASDDQPMPALLRKIQDQVERTHPLIAQILDRCGGIALAGERMNLQFASSNGIFVQRLQDPEMLRLLGDAASAVTGRRVVARIEMSDRVSARPRPPRPEPAAETQAAVQEPAPADISAEGPAGSASPRQTAAPAPSDPAPASPDAAPAPLPPVSSSPPGATDPAAPEDDAAAAALRERAEQEPRVQEFVKALRGQIVSVEELVDR